MRADRSVPGDPSTPRRAGRPHASSRAMLEEAAGELFLEQGYAATSVAEITQRAGVSRSSFFNYFPAKSDLLWAAFDDQVALLRTGLTESAPSDHIADQAESHGRLDADGFAAQASTALHRLAASLPADHIALAFTQAEAMGFSDELRLACARRTADVADVLAEAAVVVGLPPLHARVAGTAWAGALIAAVHAWALAGAERTCLSELLAITLRPVNKAFTLRTPERTTD